MSIEEVDDSNQWTMLMGEDIKIKAISSQGIEKILQDDDSCEKAYAEVGTIVSFSYYLYLQQDISKTAIEFVECMQAQIGEGDVIPALELALRRSCKGDVFTMRCTSKYAYGCIGRPPVDSKVNSAEAIAAIPADADLEYTITVLSISDITLLPHLESTRCILTVRKDCGNRWFMCQDYSRAAYLYSKAVKCSSEYLQQQKDDVTEESDDSIIIIQLYIHCLNNLAQCYLCLNEYSKAKDCCTTVLQLQQGNVKALIRACKAALALEEFRECEACIDVLKEDQSNKSLIAPLVYALKKAKASYKSKARAMEKNSARAFALPALQNQPISSVSSSTSCDTSSTRTSPTSINPEDNTCSANTTETSIEADKKVQSVSVNSGNNNVYSLFLICTSIIVLLVGIIIAIVTSNLNDML